MSGWRPINWPVVSPMPGSTFRTPSGRPASAASSANRRTDRGVCSAGLTRVEHPAASAGASFQAAISSGKFHGSTRPTTPAGSLTISATAFSPVGETLPKLLSASSPYHWKNRGTSVPISWRQSVIVFPLSRLSRTASSCAFWRTRFASRIRTSLRASGARRDHVPSSNTRRAAATARSTSARPQCATRAITAPVAGLTVSKVAPSAAGAKAPSMKACTCGFSAAAIRCASCLVRDMIGPPWVQWAPRRTEMCQGISSRSASVTRPKSANPSRVRKKMPANARSGRMLPVTIWM